MVICSRYVTDDNLSAFFRTASATRFATTASNSYILNYDSTQERSQH